MSNVRWEPVASGVVCRDDDSDMVCGVDGWLLWIRQAGRWGTVNIALPPDIRLCRAVPVTWSQEPPTEEGDYWWWTPMYAESQLCEICVVHGSLTVYDDDGYSSLLNNCLDRWWLPATVPQPPSSGEVGEVGE